MSDAGKDTETPPAPGGGDATGRRPRRRGPGASTVKTGSNSVRRRLASVVWLVAVVCALFLAIGALLVALDANEKNSIVQFVLDGAERLSGPFSRDNGIFTFDGKNAEVKSALVNWGIAAIVYLVVGKVLDRLIRP